MKINRKEIFAKSGCLFICGILMCLSSCVTKDGSLPLASEESGGISVFAKGQDDVGGKEIVLFLNGQSQGVLPYSNTDLKAGEYQITAFHPECEFEPSTKTLNVESGSYEEIVFECKATESSKLKILADSGSSVIIDGLEMGNDFAHPQNPKELSIPKGMHSISVKKGNKIYFTDLKIDLDSLELNVNFEIPKINVIEEFSNVSCPGCPVAGAYTEEFIGDNSDDNVIQITWHGSYPSPNDPLNQNASEIINERVIHFGYPAFPALFFNGLDVLYEEPKFIPKSLRDSLEANTLNSSWSLDTNYLKRSEKKLEGSINVINIDEAKSFVGADVIVVAIKKELSFPQAPGTNGQSVFHNIVRAGASLVLGSNSNLEFVLETPSVFDADYLVLFLEIDGVIKQSNQFKLDL